jgi:hypothetical protein
LITSKVVHDYIAFLPLSRVIINIDNLLQKAMDGPNNRVIKEVLANINDPLPGVRKF